MGTLRIVAGRLKGRRLRVPSGNDLRPTAEKVREALFNILGQDLSRFDLLDLFAGTGALGFEALSRGARRVTFVEADPKYAAALRRSAGELGVEGEIRVIVGRVDDLLDRARLGGPFHVILADPPYEATGEGRLVVDIDAAGLLSMHGTLVVERDSRLSLRTVESGLTLVRTATYGRTSLDFFKYHKSEATG